jgi:hypothetical protein
MHPHDRHDHVDEDVGHLPPLPLARPPEWPQAGVAPGPAPGGPQHPSPALGASFTSAATNDQPVPVQDDLDETAPHDLQVLTWELAARLTAGMLANSSRSNASVKDAMGLFDQFLHEMHAYVRISAELNVERDAIARRRSHGEYFRGSGDQTGEASVPTPPGTHAPPAAPAPAPAVQPAPFMPRPATDYPSVPPGGRYTPGSMAGTPPPPDDEQESERAA